MKFIFTRGPVLGFRFFLLGCISIALMVCDHHFGQVHKVKNVLGVVATPFFSMVDVPIKFLSYVGDHARTRSQLLAENVALKNDQWILKTQLQRMEWLEHENDQYRVLMKSLPQKIQQHMKVGQLINVASDLFIHELIIDKGSSEGVFEGEVVLDAQGILGQVIEVAPKTCRVLLLTDMRSAVPVTDVRTGMRGIVTGTGSLNQLSLINVPATVDVKAGDLLVSSNLGGRFPAGYHVGLVTQVTDVPGERFAMIRVQPAAEIHKTQPVILLSDHFGETEVTHAHH